MALGVHLLRLTMLLLNIYDTYKVLKRPRQSARSAGQPAARALSQRKRQMKGCLAVWIVWCCFMTYESIAEGVVSLLIPFYDTTKSLVLMFLILTRARGAEPIFLHVIRPLVKPYTASLDAVANVAQMFGDFVFLLSMYPFRLVWEWWQAHWESAADEAQHAMHSILQHPSSLQPGGGQRRSAPVGPVRGDDRLPFVAPAQDGARVSGEHIDNPALTGRATHEIWHPPRSAYVDEDADNGPVGGMYSALNAEVEALETRQAREQTEEWRRYPPFPSAYPPTPLPAYVHLPPPPYDPSSTPADLTLESEDVRLAREQLDEWRRYPPFPSAYPSTPLSRHPMLPSAPARDTTSFASALPARFSPILEDEPDRPEQEQDFGQSLPSPLELSIPGSVRGASDENHDNVLGLHVGNVVAGAQDDTMDEDEDDSDKEEDDDFDITLRTPQRVERTITTPAPMTRLRAREGLVQPVPVALPFLSRLSSETSSVSSESGTNSLLGLKRSRDVISPDTEMSSEDVTSGRGGSLSVSVATSTSDAEWDTDVEAEQSATSELWSPVGKRRRVMDAGGRGRGRGRGRGSKNANVGPRRIQPRRESREPPQTTGPSPARRERGRAAQAQSGVEAAARASERLAANTAGIAVIRRTGANTTVTTNVNGHGVPARSSRSRRGASAVPASMK